MAVSKPVGKAKWKRRITRYYWRTVGLFFYFRQWACRLRNRIWDHFAWAPQIRFGNGSGRVAGQEPDKLVSIVTVAWLSAMLNEFTPASSEARSKRAPFLHRLIIERILGSEWYDRCVLQRHSDPDAPIGYIGYDIAGATISKHSVKRVHNLCEMLFNLQIVPGFHDRIEQIKTKPLQEIESVYAELQAAMILCWHGINFRFVEKKHNPKLGEDYDFEVFRNCRVIAVDAKCKFEDTAVNPRTLGRALAKSRRQLPDNGPGVFIIKMPPHWLKDGRDLTQETEQEILRFFGSTSRIMSIIYYVNEDVFTSTSAGDSHHYQEIENFNCRHRHIARNLLDGFRPMQPWPDGRPRWIPIMDIIEGKL